MFKDIIIKSLQKRGYGVLSPSEARYVYDMRKKFETIQTKNCKLIESLAQRSSIKQLKEDLATKDIIHVPSKKADLIDLYIKIFQEK